jgi:hypothetical protein
MLLLFFLIFEKKIIYILLLFVYIYNENRNKNLKLIQNV